MDSFYVVAKTPDGVEKEYSFCGNYDDNAYIAQVLADCAQDAADANPCPDSSFWTEESWLAATVTFAEKM